MKTTINLSQTRHNYVFKLIRDAFYVDGTKYFEVVTRRENEPNLIAEFNSRI